MGKKKCSSCKRDFSAYLIQPVITNRTRIEMCPICALIDRNETAGFPEGTPFHGAIAAQLHKDALAEVEEMK